MLETVASSFSMHSFTMPDNARGPLMLVITLPYHYPTIHLSISPPVMALDPDYPTLSHRPHANSEVGPDHVAR